MNKPTTDPPVYTLPEVAQLLGCSEYTVMRRAQRGELPGVRFGVHWVFPRGALEASLDGLALAAAAQRKAAALPPVSAPAGGTASPPRKRGRPRRQPAVLADLPPAPPPRSR
jgi:excisionase family DNA binding protein